MKTLKSLALLAAVFLFCGSITAAAAQDKSGLHRVNRIFIDELGDSPEAARFRLLVEDELAKRSFQIANSPADADAVLSGAVSIGRSDVYGGTRDIGATVRLTSKEGVRLWNANFGGQTFTVNPVRAFRFEPISYRAKQLAKKLRSDWEKSAKG